MTKIAFYCRTSTGEQEKQETINTQLEKLKTIYKGKNIVKIYKDDGFSGAYLQRPALNQLREDIKKKAFDVLALYSLDRLSRKTGHQLFLQDELKKNGVKMEILGESFKDTPQGELSNTILSAVAQYEREVIRQRMMDGIRRKIEGGVLIGCPPPYGYKLFKRDKDKRTEAFFKINPIEAKVIQELFNTFLKENSIRATARKVSEEKNYKGGYIQPNRVAEFLRDETYIGNFYYYKTTTFIKEDEGGKLKTIKTKKPKSEWRLFKIPPVIDKTIFDRVQEILGGIRKNYIKKTKHNYLLQGVIKCIHCGAYYGGRQNQLSSKGKRYFIYLCHKKKKPYLGEERCLSKSIGSLTIERQVWDYVKDLIGNPEKIKESVRELQEKREDKRKLNRETYNGLITEKKKIQVKKSKFLDLYGDDRYSREDLGLKIEELNNQERTLERDMGKALEELKQIDEANIIEKEIERLCLEFKDSIKNASFELKKMIIRKWIKEINITDEKKIVLKVRVPLSGATPFNLNEINSKSIMGERPIHFGIPLHSYIMEFEKVISMGK